MFDQIYKDFENTVDTNNFYIKYSRERVSTRFLLIRSLDKSDLEFLYLSKTGNNMPDGAKGAQPFKHLYNTSITIDELIAYIENKRSEILQMRQRENVGLSDLIVNFDIVNCGIETDKIDDIVKRMVRDKSIKTKTQFEEKLNTILLPKTANYVRWSFYNQITNDVIEEILLRNSKIIPTLRKIHDIDFFVKIGNEIIPFDLKITHISSDFFDLYRKGLIESDGPDNFVLGDNLKEIEIVKEFFKENKARLNLPNFGGKDIVELLAILKRKNDEIANRFIHEMYQARERAVYSIEGEIKKLEWWNYKYQGPRLFKNNNRFFIFLAYTNVFEDGRALKGNIEEIELKVNQVLEDVSLDTLHTVNYRYEKQADINGDYVTKVISAYIYGRKQLD
jgi:hypothetical protein